MDYFLNGSFLNGSFHLRWIIQEWIILWMDHLIMGLFLRGSSYEWIIYNWIIHDWIVLKMDHSWMDRFKNGSFYKWIIWYVDHFTWTYDMSDFELTLRAEVAPLTELVIESLTTITCVDSTRSFGWTITAPYNPSSLTPEECPWNHLVPTSEAMKE